MGFTNFMQDLTHILTNIGIVGLPLVMLIEGSSFPFPGIVIVLSYGYILDLSPLETFLTAALMGIAYTISSFVPYIISKKIENRLPKKFKKGIEKAQLLFNHYGSWSIAFTRPFGIGNYISYVAGICKVKPLKYALLTFVGIYPWSLAVLFLGKYYKGNLSYMKHMFANGSLHHYLQGLFVLVLFILFYVLLLKKKIKKGKEPQKMVIMANREKTD